MKVTARTYSFTLVIACLLTFKKAVTPERLKVLVAKSPLKRTATPEDVAATCVFLAAPESDFITGQIIYVDGGLTAIG